MNCRRCDWLLDNVYICPHCGYEDPVVKKVIYASNRHYNEALTLVDARDLSGAETHLRQALKYNKRNIDARNLLGLIYYQTGEIVSALSEWVISTNFRREGNLASSYIEEIQNRPDKLREAGNIIRMYNTALQNIHDDTPDMAIIELKKVVNMNPGYIRAYQLLALLYMRREHYAAARKVLMKAVKVDRNNMTTLRYLKEVNAHVERPQRLRSGDAMRISDPNPIVIEDKGRQGYTEYNTGFLSFINILIGIVIGTAVVWLLLVPSITKSKTLEYNKAVVDYSAQLSERNKEISDLENDVKELQDKVNIYEAQMGKAGTSSGTGGDSIKQAVSYYLQGSRNEAAKVLAEIDPATITDETDKNIYKRMMGTVGTAAAEDLFAEAESNYENGEYLAAVEGFIKVLRLDESYSMALYYMGRSYHQLGDTINAAVCYQRLMDEYPDSSAYADADAYLQQLIKEGLDIEAVQAQLEKQKSEEKTGEDSSETTGADASGMYADDTIVTDDSTYADDSTYVDDGSYVDDGTYVDDGSSGENTGW